MDQTLIIAEINCLWESAALKVKKERAVESIYLWIS
jgi:hypothetical protein